MQMTSLQPASTASRIASAAPSAGTKMQEVSAAVLLTASATVSNTGTATFFPSGPSASKVSPPRFGVQPATTWVP